MSTKGEYNGIFKQMMWGKCGKGLDKSAKDGQRPLYRLYQSMPLTSTSFMHALIVVTFGRLLTMRAG